ncbi:hypothetical protein F5146DRAFT_1141029 [Armillaria mellea]|nr:hypothetical protein F5146DRAFT_1141029 [Armillaria mellea]
MLESGLIFVCLSHFFLAIGAAPGPFDFGGLLNTAGSLLNKAGGIISAGASDAIDDVFVDSVLWHHGTWRVHGAVLGSL